MASGVGKWEVVKKGKKQNVSSGSGGKAQDKKPGRRALREANLSQNRKKNTQTHEKHGRMVPHGTHGCQICVLLILLHRSKEMPS